MPSQQPYARLSPTLARAAVWMTSRATTALQVADLVIKVLAWQAHGYLSDTDTATVSAALQSLDVDLSSLTPSQIAQYQSVIDSARHAGAKVITEDGTYHPIDDSLDYYDEVTVQTVAYTHTSASVSHDSGYLHYETEAA